MKIRRINVDGFGTWTDLELANLAQPLVVFYGENEAGKTTLMQFVRAVLYGFSADRRHRYLPPVGGGRPGGSLTVEDAHQTFVIDRHAARHSDEEQLDVTDGHGVRREGRPLALLLDGVDEAVFNNVFAFGLSEIQELATLTDSAAADLLYELTLGLDRVSLSDVVQELDASRGRLLSADTGGTGPGQIPQLIERRDRLRREIRELAEGTGRFLDLVERRQELDRGVGELEAAEAALERRGQMLAAAQQLEPRWRSRQQLERRLAALGTLPHVADDCVAKLEDLKARLATRRNRLHRVAERRKELAGEMGRLRINDALCRQTPRLEALAEQQQWIASLDAEARRLEAELAEMSAQHKADHAADHGAGHGRENQHGHDPRAPRHGASGHQHAAGHQQAAGRHNGPGHTDKSGEHARPDHKPASAGKHAAPVAVPDKPLSPHTIAALRTQGKTLGELRRRVRKAQADMTAAQQSAHGFKQQVKSGLGDDTAESLSQSLERAGTTVSQLRRRVQLDERLDQLDRRRHEIEDKAHDSLDRQVPPTWQLISHGTMFACGVGLLLASIFMPSSMLHGWGMIVGFLGLGASGVAAVMTYGSHHMSGVQFNDCQKQLDQLKEQIAAAEKERDELDAQLPKGGGPLVSRLQAAEKEHARLEELMPLDSNRQHGVRTYKAAKADHRTSRREYKKARAKWGQAMIQAGLPADLSPRALRASIERGRELHALGRQLEDRRIQLSDCRRQHDILAERILQVAVDAELEIDEADPLALLREMLRRLDDERLRVGTRDQLRASSVKLRRVKRKLVRQVASATSRLGDLIRSSGARDEDDLRRRLDTLAEAHRLEHERQLHDDELSLALSGHEQAHEIAGSLDAGHDLKHLAEEVVGKRQTARGKLGRLWEERGALVEQIKAAAHDRRLPEKRLELAQTVESLRGAVHRWQVLGACSLALDSVREVYERQRQPEVLREASEYFARLTGGRYQRAWTSLGHRVLWVDDAQGRPLSVDKLSRGTREQLFLSLRLALVGAYARRGLHLPIVMDDVLVNFDTGRVKSAVGVLRDFAAAGHQILLFTCHEHVARLFRGAKVEVRTLPGSLLDREPAPEPIVEPPPRVVPAPHFLPPVPQPADDEDLTLAEIEDEEVPKLRVHLDTLLDDMPDDPPPAPKPIRRAKPRRPRAAQPVAAAPTRRPAPKQRVRMEGWVDRVPWSAEEFDGELSDRVRRSEPIVEYVEPQPPADIAPADIAPASARASDEELLEVQFEDDTHRSGSNGWQRH